MSLSKYLKYSNKLKQLQCGGEDKQYTIILNNTANYDPGKLQNNTHILKQTFPNIF